MTLDADRMRASVRPGDQVVVDGEAFDRGGNRAAVVVEPRESALLVVTYNRVGPGELLSVSWDTLSSYHSRENNDEPRELAEHFGGDVESDHDDREPEETPVADEVLEDALDDDETGGGEVEH